MVTFMAKVDITTDLKTAVRATEFTENTERVHEYNYFAISPKILMMLLITTVLFSSVVSAFFGCMHFIG
jgi:hypothetical protein